MDFHVVINQGNEWVFAADTFEAALEELRSLQARGIPAALYALLIDENEKETP